jgi:hypothetical protein
MKLTFKQNNTNNNFKVPSEGTHNAFIVAYLKPFMAKNMNGDEYEATRYILEVEEAANDKKLTLLSKTIRLDSLHEKSNLYSLAAAALRKKTVVATDVPDLEALLGKFVGVVVTNTEANGKTYANCESVYPLKADPTWTSTFESESDKVITISENGIPTFE